jgi:hypothetical protein
VSQMTESIAYSTGNKQAITVLFLRRLALGSLITPILPVPLSVFSSLLLKGNPISSVLDVACGFSVNSKPPTSFSNYLKNYGIPLYSLLQPFL